MEKKRFMRVAVLMGGISSERDISLRSGQAATRALTACGYEVFPVDVTEPRLALPEGTEAVFVALHGTFGEDGAVQFLLEEARMPYTGSGVVASRVAMDKVLAKEAFLRGAVPTPAYRVLQPGDAWAGCPLPAVVKPATQGSSIGVHHVIQADQMQEALTDAFRYDDRVLVEAYIPGRELTVGVLVDQALPVVEIAPPDGWYGYQQKYSSGQTQYNVPADLSPQMSNRLQTLAWKAFSQLGCEGVARVDFRLPPEGEPMVLEVNTIPGLTETSLLPKAAAAAGISFEALCGMVMETARCGKRGDLTLAREGAA